LFSISDHINKQDAKIAIIGECMLEFSTQVDNLYKLSYGGDTLNTAIYAARCGEKADYVTVLGDDAFSLNMLKEWQNEGVGTQHIKIKTGGVPGLYVIENDHKGERTFHYWRDSSPIRSLIADYSDVLTSLYSYQMIL